MQYAQRFGDAPVVYYELTIQGNDVYGAAIQCEPRFAYEREVLLQHGLTITERPRRRRTRDIDGQTITVQPSRVRLSAS